jgi:hypothetical protein
MFESARDITLGCISAYIKVPLPFFTKLLQEPKVKCSEQQDNSYVYEEPSPEMISEEKEIDTDYKGYHYNNEDYIHPQGIFIHINFYGSFLIL